MLQAILQILPLIVIFLVGYGLKRAKFMTEADGSSLLKLFFYVGSPAIIFNSIMTAKLDGSLVLLSLLGPAVVGGCLLATFLLRKSLLTAIDHKTFGTIVIGAAIMNLGFLLPFVQREYGSEGVARLLIIDTVNAFITYSLIYGIAVKFGQESPNKRFIAQKLLISPPLWAMVIAMAYKLGGFTPSVPVMDATGLVSAMVGPLILIALGLKFTPRLMRVRLLPVPLILRFGIGLAVGLGFVQLLGLEGLNADIAILASLAPVGFNSITFSEMEKLDAAFASAQVSASIILGLLLIPVTIFVLR